MVKMKLSFLILLAAGLPACGVLRRPRPVMDTSQDGRIHQEVEARLAAEPALREGSIRVEVRGGTVLLHGSVHGIGAWRCALTNADLVAGVRTVVDFMVLERGSSRANCLAPRAPVVDMGADPVPGTG